jgi:hypothetical protein
MGDYLLSSSNYMSDDGGSVIYHQFVELPIVVPVITQIVGRTRALCDLNQWTTH